MCNCHSAQFNHETDTLGPLYQSNDSSEAQYTAELCYNTVVGDQAKNRVIPGIVL